ncbi:MAG: hypothetical protein JWP85_2085 [Rhodoglobus sp.]|nr:hypothetical protein [Rhodoglobus sp.]
MMMPEVIPIPFGPDGYTMTPLVFVDGRYETAVYFGGERVWRCLFGVTEELAYEIAREQAQVHAAGPQPSIEPTPYRGEYSGGGGGQSLFWLGLSIGAAIVAVFAAALALLGGA